MGRLWSEYLRMVDVQWCIGYVVTRQKQCGVRSGTCVVKGARIEFASHRTAPRFAWRYVHVYCAQRIVYRVSRTGVPRCKKMREEGIEPPTAGSGIQRSTTELFPHR